MQSYPSAKRDMSALSVNSYEAFGYWRRYSVSIFRHFTNERRRPNNQGTADLNRLRSWRRRYDSELTRSDNSSRRSDHLVSWLLEKTQSTELRELIILSTFVAVRQILIMYWAPIYFFSTISRHAAHEVNLWYRVYIYSHKYCHDVGRSLLYSEADSWNIWTFKLRNRIWLNLVRLSQLFRSSFVDTFKKI